MKNFLKFIVQDKGVLPVFGMCTLFHILISIYRKDLFTNGWFYPTFTITMSNIGVTLIFLIGLYHYKKDKK